MTDREKFEAYFWPIAEGMKDCGVGFAAIACRKTQLWECWQAALASQQTADEGWIEWAGGECPVSFDVMVEAKFADGYQNKYPAGVVGWRWSNDHSDIIAYRVVKP